MIRRHPCCPEKFNQDLKNDLNDLNVDLVVWIHLNVSLFLISTSHKYGKFRIEIGAPTFDDYVKGMTIHLTACPFHFRSFLYFVVT